jgi:site-specific recombinase XerD
MKKNETALSIYKKDEVAQIKNAAFQSLSEATRNAYQNDYDLFFKVINKHPNKVTASDILNFIEYLEKNEYKNSSINRKVASLSKMFKVMIIAGEVKVNPVEALKQFRNVNLRVDKEVRNTLTMSDIKKAIKITSKTTLQDRKHILMIRALAKTGLRISELLSIRHKDIKPHDKETMIIRIVGKGSKERFIFLENSFIAEVEKEFPRNDKIDYLFYTQNFTPYDRRNIWDFFKKFFYEKLGKHVHPHLLRHVYITHKISIEKQDIKAVSRYAGHADVSTTLNMYIDTALDSKQSNVEI